MRRNEGRKEGRREGRKEGRKRTTRLFSSGRMNLIKIDEIGTLSPAAAWWWGGGGRSPRTAMD